MYLGLWLGFVLDPFQAQALEQATTREQWRPRKTSGVQCRATAGGQRRQRRRKEQERQQNVVSEQLITTAPTAKIGVDYMQHE